MIILKDGTYYEPSDEEIIKWQRAYDKIDVHKELEAIANWADANPSKRKVNGPRFVVNWLKRANDSGGSPFAQKNKSENGKISIRDMELEDELYHDFLGTHQEYFLNKYGRCFTKTGERMTREQP